MSGFNTVGRVHVHRSSATVAVLQLVVGDDGCDEVFSRMKTSLYFFFIAPEPSAPPKRMSLLLSMAVRV